MRKSALTPSLIALLAAFAWSGSAAAQSYPDRPVKIVVPYAAGGNTDGQARVIAGRLSDVFNQQFVIENRGGASGAIGMEAVKASPADGYTLLVFAISQVAILPALTKVKYDPIADFTPISNFGYNAFVLTVNPKIPAKTPQDLIAWVKTQDNPTYASAGYGTHSNLALVSLMQRSNFKMAAVNLRGGAELMNAVVAGHIPIAMMNASDVVQQAAAGTLRPLAVTSKDRVIQLPDVPTMQEAGFADFEVVTWNGFGAPAGTPKAIVDRLSSEVQKAMTIPKIQEQFAGLGVVPHANSPEEFAAEIKSDVKRWGDVIRSAGLDKATQ